MASDLDLPRVHSHSLLSSLRVSIKKKMKNWSLKGLVLVLLHMVVAFSLQHAPMNRNSNYRQMFGRRIRKTSQGQIEIGLSSSSSSSSSSPSERRDESGSRSRKTSLQLMTPVIEAFSAAFVGGTVGVMGMAFIVETRKLQDESLDMCPYCMGSGEILCGECLGLGEAIDAVTGSIAQCSSCQGRKQVLCINCKGDGRNTPILLQSRSARDPDYAVAGKLNEFDLDSP